MAEQNLDDSSAATRWGRHLINGDQCWWLVIAYWWSLTRASCLIWLKEGYWGFILYFANFACRTVVIWFILREWLDEMNITDQWILAGWFVHKISCLTNFQEVNCHLERCKNRQSWSFTWSGEKYRNQSQNPQMSQVAIKFRATIKSIQSMVKSLPGPKAG